MIVTMLLAGLVLLAVLGSRFGADSRDVERTGWIAERPQPQRSAAPAGALQPHSEPPSTRCPRPIPQTT
jgi:hypothetical protein